MDTMIMKMPAVALRGMVILPGMVAHFDVSRAKSIKAVEEAMMDEQKIFLVAQKDVEQENPDIEDLFKIGIIAEVKQVIKLQNNIVRILVEGKERAELSAFLENPDYLLAEIIRFDEEVDDGLPEEAKEAMLRSIQETFGKYVVVNPKMGKELQRQLSEITDLEKLMNQLANSLPVHFEEKQKILDAVSMTERYEVLMALLLKEIEIIAIKNDFQAKVKAHVDKNQKEYLLREQMKVIREELGEDNTESDADHFAEALGKIRADKEVKEMHHWVIYRYAETLLTYAESMLEAFDNPDYTDNDLRMSARTALNMVRKNASMPDVTVTDKGEFIKALRNEWRVEFAFEDHRFWDLRRCLLPLDTTIEGIQVTRTDNGLSYEIKEIEQRPLDALRYYYLPLPNDELLTNPNLKNNMGWNNN